MIKLRLTTLTPIFISSGKELDAFDYALLGSNFYKLNSDKIINFVIQKDKSAINKIDSWIEEKSYNYQSQSNQNLNNNNLNILTFISNYLHNQILLKDVENRICSGEFSFYKMPHYLDRNFGKKILSCLKTADNKVYIPGSTIKGMIRTALFNDYFQRLFTGSDSAETKNMLNQNFKIIENSLQKISTPNDKDKKKFDNNLLSSIFVCKDKNDQYDAKFDLMKFIKVSDTNYYEPNQVCKLVRPDIVKRNGTVTSNLNAIELIKCGIEFEFTIDFEIDYFRNVYEKYKKEKSNLNHDWKDLEKKFELLFDLKLQDLSKNIIKETIFDKLKNAMIYFSQDVLVIDINFQPKINQNNVKYPILSKVKQELENEQIIAKIGWGGGYHSKTLYPLNFYQDSEERPGEEMLYFNDLYQKIVDKFRIGYSTKAQNHNKVDLKTVPNTRKSVKLDNFYDQLGWVKIEQIQ